jgi:uncharacterized phage protein (TIGR02218 family)
MRNVPSQLLSVLNANTAFLLADLYTITLLDGTVLRWTTCDIALVLAGQTYTPQGTNGVPLLKRNGWECATGLQIGSLDLSLLCGDTATLNGSPLVLEAYNGAFDNAAVVLQRAFMLTWGQLNGGAVPVFTGVVASQDIQSAQVDLKINDALNRLTVQMPRNLFLPLCTHLLYDAGCTVSKAANTFNLTMGASPTVNTLQASVSTGQPAGTFESGVLVVTSGKAAGARRGVRTFDGTTFTLSTPLPAAPSEGDSFTVSKGCDRLLTTCTTRFANQANWRGFDNIPPAEYSL